MNIIIVSVLSGWQSYNVDTNEYFGPIYASTFELWKWQQQELTRVQ